MTRINHIAQAFAAGVKFAENLKLAMDAAKGKDDEDGHWVTIGEGEEARPVFIKGAKKKAAKTESKKAESKPAQRAQTKGKAGTKPAGALTEKGKALADLVKKEYGKVVDEIRQNFVQTHKDIDKFSDPAYKIPGVDFRANIHIQSGLSTIKNYTESLADQINMTAREVAKAAEHDDFNRAGVENVGSKIKQLEKKSKNLAGRTDTAMHGLGRMSTNGHEDAARDITKLKDEAIKLDRESYDLYHETLEAIRQYSRSRQEKAESKPAQQRTKRTASQSQPRAQQSTSGEVQTVKTLEDAYNVSADLIDEMTPKQADRPFLSRLDSLHKKAVALAKNTPEINNSQELREMARIMKQADKLVKALPSYYDRNYYGGWVQNIMGKVRAAEEAYAKLIIKASLKKRKTRGPNAAI